MSQTDAEALAERISKLYPASYTTVGFPKAVWNDYLEAIAREVAPLFAQIEQGDAAMRLYHKHRKELEAGQVGMTDRIEELKHKLTTLNDMRERWNELVAERDALQESLKIGTKMEGAFDRMKIASDRIAELEEAAKELEQYTYDVLTGPVMTAGVTWEKDPREQVVPLKKMRDLLK